MSTFRLPAIAGPSLRSARLEATIAPRRAPRAYIWRVMMVRHIALALAAVALASPALAATPCAELKSLKLANTTITLAEPVAAGPFVQPGRAGGAPPAAAPALMLPAYCRVAATLTPTSDSDIKIEVWLPSEGWNGKYEAVGNGGWAGI